MNAVAELGESIGAAAEGVGPGVVGLGRGWGHGSGVVVAPGQVLTNAHAVRHGEVTVNFADGRRERGHVAGADPDLDLAVLAVDTGDAPAVGWEPGAGPPPIGTAVVALANPGGRGLRATLGFVSAEGRRFRTPGGRRIEGGIEHTAPLPRGSSGGPLVGLDGNLIGINTLRREGGLILAVPASADVRERATRLGRGDTPRRRRLGVAIAPPRAARRMRRAVGLPERAGLLVRAVERESPANRAGIERGDLLVAANGVELEGVDGLYSALEGLPEGDTLELGVVRGTDERSVAVDFDGAA
jgi:serine protease Do